MENIKELIRENLIFLRKTHKLTQLELSQKINYSDKAISRWETGEVTPDIETLNVLSEIYGVPIETFFKKNSQIKQALSFNRVQNGNKFLVALLCIVSAWLIGTITFVYLQSADVKNAWLSFIWPVPVSFLLAVIFNEVWWKNWWSFVFFSGLVWSLITAVFLSFLEYNWYLLYIVGIPVQICIILLSFMKIQPKTK